MGGQTALNCALDLWHNGVLAKYTGAATGKPVELIGATPEAIDKAEDRLKFKDAMTKIGLGSARSGIAHSMDEAWAVQKTVGFPTVIRPSFTLGGTGRRHCLQPRRVRSHLQARPGSLAHQRAAD
jgi:carbamoyl-phosphate synthase large subunit